MDTVQAEALRIACGAARGTSTAAIQVDTGEPPLQLRRLQLQLQYAVKVKSQKSHPASVVLQPHWLIKSRHFDKNTNLIYEKVFAYIVDTDITEYENTLSTSDPPWRRKQCKVDISVSKAATKTENPDILQALAMEKLDLYKSHLHIFTSASKCENRNAAAYCIPSLDIEYSCRLPDIVSIFSREMTAIKLALVCIKENCNICGFPDKIAILSDSLSVLTAIKKRSTVRPRMLDDFLNIINEISAEILSVLIPSHLGIKGNEKVDLLAKTATNKGEIHCIRRY